MLRKELIILMVCSSLLWGSKMKYYSKKTCGFYDSELQESYIENDSWPEDLIEISEEDYQSFLKGKQGYKISVADNKLFWDEIVYNTEDKISKNKNIRSNLLDVAYAKLKPLEYAKDLGISTEQELAMSSIWKEYVVSLSRLVIDEETVDTLVWPSSPEDIITT